ncbi:MAG: NifU family protein [Rhodospirillales bacterium]|nr:NifU family protein [Rhodospirillales bacterium]
MFIQTEETPNPSTLKFLPGLTVMSRGTAEFSSEEEAFASPLAEKLFTLTGVTNVFYGQDFISVSKAANIDWHQLKTPVMAHIMDHYTMGAPLFKDGFSPMDGKSKAPLDDEISNQIIELLETRVQPAVARDGGDIEFYDYVDGIVYLKMRGACAGCPSSQVTLKMGIENMLKHFIPEVKEVRPVS